MNIGKNAAVKKKQFTCIRTYNEGKERGWLNICGDKQDRGVDPTLALGLLGATPSVLNSVCVFFFATIPQNSICIAITPFSQCRNRLKRSGKCAHGHTISERNQAGTEVGC